MSNRGAIGFGGFLLGLGAGYLVFRELNLTFNSVAWVLVIIGATIIASALIRWVSPNLGLHKVVNGLTGGLFLALFLTQGFSFFTGIVNFGNPYLPYSTSEVKTYTGVSTSDSVYLRLGTMNGEITLTTWDKNEYSMFSTITARGSTQKEADDNLANLGKNLVRSDIAAQQSLTLVYTSATFVNNPYQINIEVKLPAKVKLDLDLTTSNGVVTVSNVNGGNVVVHTSNGALRLNNVKADILRGSTSNGALTGSIDATTCTLSTSNGPMALELISNLSGTYTLQTSNGKVDVTVGSNAAYRLDASTSNGDVTFDLPNLTYSKTSRTAKTAQTVGYDAADTKISVNIQTSNSNITVDRNVALF